MKTFYQTSYKDRFLYINLNACFPDEGCSIPKDTVKIKQSSKLTLKIIRLSIHEDVVDKNYTEDTGPQVQVTE